MSVSIEALEETARRCRVEIVKMVYRAQAGHPGGSLSEIDLIAALYSTSLQYVLKILIGKTETDSSFPKGTHHLECTQFWLKKDSLNMKI